ncbi:hypothetical protein ACQKEF_22400 [Pseudomonas oryzihabitans]|uniref:hypothetical protein n=1 Tax=Pseudomonas oryzihabitans TaxID=47885 RepID=UPI003D04B876
MNTVQAALNPEGPGQQDELTQWLRESAGFKGAKRLSDGSYAGVISLITTYAICLQVDGGGYSRRFCFRDLSVCLSEYERLSSAYDTPQGWVARRPEEL